MNDTANDSANTGPEEKVLERVRALLAKAEGTDYPAEAETYAAKAAELIARHGVEQAMLEARDGGGDPVESREIAVSDPYRMVKAVLLKSVAEGLPARCSTSRPRSAFGTRSSGSRTRGASSGTPETDLRARWVASPDQLDLAAALFTDPRVWAVIVPIALPGKEPGWWATGQPVEHVAGLWPVRSDTEYRAARDGAFDGRDQPPGYSAGTAVLRGDPP